MTEELISEYVDRTKFESDTTFIETQLKKVEELFDRVNGVKISLKGATSLKDISSAAEEGVKTNARLEQSIKAVKAVIDQRFASEAKLVTLQTDYKKVTVANTLEIQKQNKELKDQAAYNAANTGSIEKARAAVRLLNTERNQLNLYTKEGKLRQAELNEQIDKYNNFIKKSVDALSAQKINIGNYEGSAKIIVEALEKEKQKLEELEKTKIRVQNAGSTFTPGVAASRTTVTGFAGGDSSAGMSNLKNAAAGTEKEIEKLNDEIAKSRTVIEGFSRITEQPKFLNIASKVGDANQELRFFTKSLIDLERNGLGSSKAADELRKHLAELTDQIGDAKAEVKALSSDTRSFDLFAGSVSFAADAFQLFAGAAVLAGASEEDAAAATKTLVAVQSVANGVKGIANELTTRGTAANKLYAFAQNQVAIATDASATSANRFKAALITTGIGALIIAVGYLVLNFNKLKEAFSNVSQEQKTLNEINKVTAENAGQEIAKLDQLYAVATNTSLAIKERKKAVDALQEQYPDYFKNLKDEIILQGGAKSAYDSTKLAILEVAKTKAIETKLTELSTKELELDYQKRENLRKKQDNDIQKRKADQKNDGRDSETRGLDQFNAIAQGTDLLSELGDINKGLDQIDKDKQFLLDQITTVDAKTTKPEKEKKKASDDTALKDALEAEKRKDAAIKALALENANELIRINQSVVDNDDASLKDKVNALGKISDQQKIIAGIEFAGAVESEIKIEKGKRVVIQKSQEEIEAATVAHDNKIKVINEALLTGQVTAQKEAKEKILKELEDQRKKELDLLESTQDDLRNANEKEYNDAVIGLDSRLERGLLNQSDYDKKRAKLDSDYQTTSLEAEIQYQKKLIDLSDISVDAKKEALKKLSDFEKQLAEAKKKQRTKEQQEEIDATLSTIATIQRVADETFSFISGILNAQETATKNRLKQQSDEAEKKAARDIEVVNASSDAEETKAAKITLINARLQAQKDQIAQRERQAEITKAKFDKSVAIFNIILATAVNVAKALTPVGRILAAVSGAAQLAVAFATPIPKYFKGKKKGEPYSGPAVVNDHPDGRTMEVIERADGTIEMPSGRNVITHVGANDIIHPNAQEWRDHILNAAYRDATAMMRTPAKRNSEGPREVKLDAQATKLLKQIADRPELHLSASDGGMKALWQWVSRQVSYTDQNTNW